MKYEETNTSAERWLILGDKNQKFPTTDLIVNWSGERKTAKGATMPVLILEDNDGEKYVICAWKRDVLECINQYGNDTEQWNAVKFENKNGRMQLVPADMKIIEIPMRS